MRSTERLFTICIQTIWLLADKYGNIFTAMAKWRKLCTIYK